MVIIKLWSTGQYPVARKLECLFMDIYNIGEIINCCLVEYAFLGTPAKVCYYKQLPYL